MSEPLPGWARAALDAYAPLPGLNETQPNEEAVKRHQLLFLRVEKDWLVWSAPFLKCIRPLSETGKQIVLESALWVAKYHRLNFGEHARVQMNELRILHDKISLAADELARLLGERDDLVGKGNVNDNMPHMEDLIEQAAKFYPDWAMVAKNDIDHMRRFLINSRTQSRPGPTPLDLAMVLARPYEARYSNEAADAVVRRNSGADIARLMIHATSNIHHPDVLEKFSLSDAAIAALCNALYGVEDFSAANLKTMRARDRARKNG